MIVLGAEHHLISNAVNSTEAAVHVYITGSQRRLTLHVITIVHTLSYFLVSPSITSNGNVHCDWRYVTHFHLVLFFFTAPSKDLC